MSFIKNNIVALVAIVIAIVACFLPVLPNGKSVFGTVSTTCQGSTTCIADLYATTQFSGGGSGSIRTDGSLQVSSTGTTINGINFGACTIWTNSHTISATSSKQIVCQTATNGTLAVLTGSAIVKGAVCNLMMASSTKKTSGGLVVSGVSASTTAGYIVANLSNFTGTTFTWSAAASSSSQWNYTCLN